MGLPADDALVEQTKDLLEPGEITLNAVIVQTAFGSDDELEMHEATVEIGEVIAQALGVDDMYVYSGNDDPEFSSNQHQGRSLASDDFIWECQQILRGDTFELVYYYEATRDQNAIIADLDGAGYSNVTSVRGDGTNHA